MPCQPQFLHVNRTAGGVLSVLACTAQLLRLDEIIPGSGAVRPLRLDESASDESDAESASSDDSLPG